MSMHELELKFQVPPGLRASLTQELLRHGGRRMHLLARYFDTPDGLLGSHAISLRLRHEGRRWVQTLKAAGRNAVHRLEHEVVLRVPAGTEPALDLSRHDGTPAGDQLRALLTDVTESTLAERFATDITRLAALLRTPAGTVEAAFDLGAVRAGERAAPVCELELELVEGDAAAVFEIAALWRAHGGLWLDTRSKARRGADQAEGREFGPPVKARPPSLAPDMSGDAVVRATVNAALDQVLANGSEVGAGSRDEEHVHQLRVGLRRLRTALRELGPLAQGVDPAWEEQLAGTFARLGALRDDDTVASAVQPLLEQAHAPRLRWAPQTTGIEPAAIVRDGPLQDTLLSLLRWALDEQACAASPVSAEDARAHVEQRLARLHKQVDKSGRRFIDLPTEEQHQVRKRLKRLRYVAELVSSWWPQKAVRRYLKQLTPAQDALGHHNDVIVATDRFRADAEREPASHFAAGYLLAHQARTAADAHAALADVKDARRFWKR
jgi:inorganic triphosphatase YgiF